MDRLKRLGEMLNLMSKGHGATEGQTSIEAALLVYGIANDSHPEVESILVRACESGSVLTDAFAAHELFQRQPGN